MGDEKAGGRRRAVGTRDRVMSHLLMVGEVKDASGMASTALAEAIAYPGSSIAFAQLLSGMERSGLIEREIRGKRTYRISPARGAVAPARADGAPRRGTQVAAAQSGAESAEEFDYDELARRLLLQVVQRLGTQPVEGPEPPDAAPGEGADSERADSEVSLARAVAGLEQKLASVRSTQREADRGKRRAARAAAGGAGEPGPGPGARRGRPGRRPARQRRDQAA